MTALSQDGLEHKTRVEHDFWRPALDRSLEAWLLAPNDEKTDLLLNGQILNWAESWLLTHPTDVSANQRNFILRSLAAQQRKSSGQREQLVRAQTRKESRYIWVIMGCAFVALIPTINDFKKDLKQELKRELVKHVLDGQQPSSMRVVLRALVKKLRAAARTTAKSSSSVAAALPSSSVSRRVPIQPRPPVEAAMTGRDARPTRLLSPMRPSTLLPISPSSLAASHRTVMRAGRCRWPWNFLARPPSHRRRRPRSAASSMRCRALTQPPPHKRRSSRRKNGCHMRPPCNSVAT